MSEAESEVIRACTTKPLECKRYIDDVFSLWDTTLEEINLFISKANKFHPTVKFKPEMAEKEINFLDTTIFKAERFYNGSVLDVRTYFKATETFQYALSLHLFIMMMCLPQLEGTLVFWL